MSLFKTVYNFIFKLQCAKVLKNILSELFLLRFDTFFNTKALIAENDYSMINFVIPKARHLLPKSPPPFTQKPAAFKKLLTYLFSKARRLLPKGGKVWSRVLLSSADFAEHQPIGCISNCRIAKKLF
jgi:hypothetical protein